MRRICFYIILVVTIVSCNASQKKQVAQLALKDSSSLVHIRGSFYKSSTGQLFERTMATTSSDDSLILLEYFNGKLPQELDPMTFEKMNGWYARDKNVVYYYRPTSGGMLITPVLGADAPSFTVLSGHYLYAVDNSHVFTGTQILQGLQPGKLNITRDSSGMIRKLMSDTTSYVVED